MTQPQRTRIVECGTGRSGAHRLHQGMAQGSETFSQRSANLSLEAIHMWGTNRARDNDSDAEEAALGDLTDRLKRFHQFQHAISDLEIDLCKAHAHAWAEGILVCLGTDPRHEPFGRQPF